MEKMVRLGQALPSFDVVSTVGIIQDVGPETADLYATLEMVANGVKPLAVLVSQEELYPSVLDLLERARAARRNLPVVEYVPPARFDEYRRYGLSTGLKEVFSGPFVRSSYMADIALAAAVRH